MAYDIRFNTVVQGKSDLEQIPRIIEQLSQKTKASDNDLRLFSELLESAVHSGESLTGALKRIGNEASKGYEAVARLAKQGLRDLQDEERQLNKQESAWRSLARAQEQANRENAERNASPLDNQVGGVIKGGALGILGLGAVGGIGLQVGRQAAEELKDAIVGLTTSFAEAARETQNFADRVGISAEQARRFEQIAQITGTNAHAIEGGIRLISTALEDQAGAGKRAADALHRLGISFVEAGGGTRELGDVTLEAIQKLAAITDKTERAREATALFGRGAKELTPLIEQYAEVDQKLNDLGLSIDHNLIEKGLEAQKTFDTLTVAFKALRDELGAKIAPLVTRIAVELTLGISGKAQGGGSGTIPGAIGTFPVGNYGPGNRRPGDLNGNIVDFVNDTINRQRDALSAAVTDATDPLARPGVLVGPGKDVQSVQDRSLPAGKAVADQYRKTFLASKEGMEARIRELESGPGTSGLASKSLADLRKELFAGDLYGNAAQGTRDEITRRDKEIKGLRDQIEAANKAKHLPEQQHEEELRLAKELGDLRAKELTGLDAINAKHQAEIELLKQKKLLTPTSRGLLLGQLVEETNRYNQGLGIAQAQNQRSIKNTAIEQDRRLDKARSAGEAEIALAQGKSQGEDESAIQNAFEARLREANKAFQDAARQVDELRKQRDERQQLRPDEKQLGVDNRAILDAQIKAGGDAAEALYQAQKHRILELTALDKKRWEDQVAEAKNARAIIDTITKSDVEDQKAQLRRRSQLIEAQSDTGPGHELDTFRKQLDLRRQSAQIDRDERRRSLEAEIADQERLKNAPGADRKQVEQEIARLRAEEIANQRDFERELGDERIEIETRIAEIRKRSEEEYKQFVVGLVNAGLTGGHATSDYLRQFGQKIFSQIVSNVAGLTFDSFKKLVPKIPGQTDAEGKPTVLGKILAGTPFGDQEGAAKRAQQDLIRSHEAERKSVDLNTEALEANTRAQQHARHGEGKDDTPEVPSVDGHTQAVEANTASNNALTDTLARIHRDNNGAANDENDPTTHLTRAIDRLDRSLTNPLIFSGQDKSSPFVWHFGDQKQEPATHSRFGVEFGHQAQTSGTPDIAGPLTSNTGATDLNTAALDRNTRAQLIPATGERSAIQGPTYSTVVQKLAGALAPPDIQPAAQSGFASIFGSQPASSDWAERPSILRGTSDLLSSLPHFAEGGVVDKPTLAVLGEKHEREYIVPESKLTNAGSTMSLQDIDIDVIPPGVRRMLSAIEKDASHNQGLGEFGVSLPESKLGLALQAATVLPVGRLAKSANLQLLEREHWPAFIKDLKLPPAWTDVRVSTDPAADLLAIGKDAKGRSQYVYSEAFQSKQSATKFERIRQLNGLDEPTRAAIDKTNPKQAEHGEALYIVQKLGIRPGSEVNTLAEKQAYGATTLEGRHVITDDSGVRLQFTGKKGVALDLPVKDPSAAEILTRRKQTAGDTGQLFPSVSATSLRDFTHEVYGDVKVKDFRTRLGTASARELIAEMPVPADLKFYNKSVKRVATQVAEILGNTPSVAVKSYIDPSVFDAWRESVKAQAPAPQLGGEALGAVKRARRAIASAESELQSKSLPGQGGTGENTPPQDQPQKPAGGKPREGDVKYVRFGKPPESSQSLNHRDNLAEQGVSAHRLIFHQGEWHLDTAGIGFTTLLDNRPQYELKGEVVGTGSDGEPLLQPTKAIRFRSDIRTLPSIEEAKHIPDSPTMGVYRHKQTGLYKISFSTVPELSDQWMPGDDLVSRLGKRYPNLATKVEKLYPDIRSAKRPSPASEPPAQQSPAALPAGSEIPKYATGAEFNKPTIAEVGEEGTEYLIPKKMLDRANPLPAGLGAIDPQSTPQRDKLANLLPAVNLNTAATDRNTAAIIASTNALLAARAIAVSSSGGGGGAVQITPAQTVIRTVTGGASAIGQTQKPASSFVSFIGAPGPAASSPQSFPQSSIILNQPGAVSRPGVQQTAQLSKTGNLPNILTQSTNVLNRIAAAVNSPAASTPQSAGTPTRQSFGTTSAWAERPSILLHSPNYTALPARPNISSISNILDTSVDSMQKIESAISSAPSFSSSVPASPVSNTQFSSELGSSSAGASPIIDTSDIVRTARQIALSPSGGGGSAASSSSGLDSILPILGIGGGKLPSFGNAGGIAPAPSPAGTPSPWNERPSLLKDSPNYSPLPASVQPILSDSGIISDSNKTPVDVADLQATGEASVSSTGSKRSVLKKALDTIDAKVGLGQGNSSPYSGLSGFSLGASRHTGDVAGIFTGVGKGPGGVGAESLSTSERIGAGVGTGAAVATGAIAAIKGFEQGGARGDLQGIGSILGTAAILTPPPFNAILGIGAAITGIVSSLLGDPRAEREKQIKHEIASSQYLDPVAFNISQDMHGNFTDTDQFGNVRSSNFRSTPQVAEPYLYFHGSNYVAPVPGNVIAPFSLTPNTPAQPPSSQTIQNIYGSVYNGPTSTGPVNAIDTQSFTEALMKQPDSIGAAVAGHLKSGDSALAQQIRYMVNA
jgi:DNA topoisomerase-1